MEPNKNINIKCPLCENSYNNILSISNHWARTHKQATKLLWLKLNNFTTDPTCKCGCGEEVKFLDAGRGFSDYVRGHAARIDNNFQTEKSKTNSLKTRKKMLEEGTWKPFALKETGKCWGFGLTKETDKRIAKIVESNKITEEKTDAKSKRMREGRMNGTIPTQYGPNSSQWKGGTSNLVATIRANTKLYREWKYPILKQANFQCTQCNSTNNLEVHHNKEGFSDIIRKIALENDWDHNLTTSIIPEDVLKFYELKLKISDLVAEYHIKNNISGIVLCKKCHKLFHNKHNL